MTAEPIPQTTSASKKPDHVKRGLIAVTTVLVIIIAGVGIRMALQKPKPLASAPAVQPEASVQDPQNTFLQEFDQQKKRATPAAAQAAAAQPDLPQGEIEAMQELRKSMSVKSAPAREAPASTPAPPPPAQPITAANYDRRSQDLDRQIQDLNRRIEEGKRK